MLHEAATKLLCSQLLYIRSFCRTASPTLAHAVVKQPTQCLNLHTPKHTATMGLPTCGIPNHQLNTCHRLQRLFCQDQQLRACFHLQHTSAYIPRYMTLIKDGLCQVCPGLPNLMPQRLMLI